MSGMQHNENATPINCRATGAIPQFARVKWAAVPSGGDPKSTYVEVAAGADIAVGIALRETFAEGDRVAVRTFSSDGSLPVIAGGAVAAGAQVIPANGGKFVAGAGEWTALSAAAADGEYISIVRNGTAGV